MNFIFKKIFRNKKKITPDSDRKIIITRATKVTLKDFSSTFKALAKYDRTERINN